MKSLRKGDNFEMTRADLGEIGSKRGLDVALQLENVIHPRTFYIFSIQVI